MSGRPWIWLAAPTAVGVGVRHVPVVGVGQVLAVIGMLGVVRNTPLPGRLRAQPTPVSRGG